MYDRQMDDLKVSYADLFVDTSFGKIHIIKSFMFMLLIQSGTMTKTVYPIDIYYNGIGIINAPFAEEYEEMFQERLKQKYSNKEKTA